MAGRLQGHWALLGSVPPFSMVADIQTGFGGGCSSHHWSPGVRDQ